MDLLIPAGSKNRGGESGASMGLLFGFRAGAVEPNFALWRAAYVCLFI
jgi:hypothetical protein